MPTNKIHFSCQLPLNALPAILCLIATVFYLGFVERLIFTSLFGISWAGFALTFVIAAAFSIALYYLLPKVQTTVDLDAQTVNLQHTLLQVFNYRTRVYPFLEIAQVEFTSNAGDGGVVYLITHDGRKRCIHHSYSYKKALAVANDLTAKLSLPATSMVMWASK